jgi:hypothetical protein
LSGPYQQTRLHTFLHHLDHTHLGSSWGIIRRKHFHPLQTSPQILRCKHCSISQLPSGVQKKETFCKKVFEFCDDKMRGWQKVDDGNVYTCDRWGGDSAPLWVHVSGTVCRDLWRRCMLLGVSVGRSHWPGASCGANGRGCGGRLASIVCACL